MNTHRKTARIVGVLFIIATVSLFAESLYKPILSSPDYLDIIYPNEITVIVGILLESIMIPAMFLIPIFLFPILKKHNNVLALGYLGFRSLESVLISIAEINKLSLVNLSRDYLNKGGADASYYQNIGSSIQSRLYWVNTDGVIYVAIFAIGALILYSALYRSKLIPRWLSGWGFIAAIAILTAPVISASTNISPEIEVLLVTPIGLQEMFMAVWLIVKGFNPSAIAPGSARKDINEV
jgi:hypothetical protein